MDDNFISTVMSLLQQYIQEDEGVASDMLQTLGVPEEDIDAILYTIRNMAKHL